MLPLFCVLLRGVARNKLLSGACCLLKGFFSLLNDEVWKKLFEETWRRSEDLFEQAVGFVLEL